jgi:hypothetical protein
MHQNGGKAMMNKQGITLLLTVGLVAFALAMLPCQLWARDNDGDGYHVHQGDCDDNNPNVYPGAPEFCNGLDDDCDGTADDACLACDDDDGDLYFAAAGCETLVDCNDGDNTVNPGASEDCADGIDNDCDGDIDAADSDCCSDSDGDTFYAGTGCGSPDCNDNDPTINPLASEDCTDTVDNDCDGDIDAADSDCPGAVADTDQDGFDDSVEILTPDAFTLALGLALWDGRTSVPGYTAGCTTCMNPNIPTLFVIVRLATPTKLDLTRPIEDYLRFLTDPVYGLGWNVLVLKETAGPIASRVVANNATHFVSDQMAVLLIEDPDPGTGNPEYDPWGISHYNTKQVPGKGIGRIYSQRIANANAFHCAQNTSAHWECQDVYTGFTYLSGLLQFQSQAWVSGHEPLHVLGGVPGGDHHDLASKNILLKEVIVTIKGGRVKYYIETTVADTTIPHLSFY